MNALEHQLRDAMSGVGDGRHAGYRVTVRIICTDCKLHRANVSATCPNCGSEDFAFVKATPADVLAAEAQFAEAYRAMTFARFGFVPMVTES